MAIDSFVVLDAKEEMEMENNLSMSVMDLIV